MKLTQTKDYLLLIDEEAEIKEENIAIHDFGMGYDLEIPCDKDNLKSNTRKLVIAYYPRTKEAKELDLPLLPNPFKEEVDVEKLACAKYNVKDGIRDYDEKYYNGTNVAKAEAFIEGYKAAQSKRFSLDDMKKAFNAGYDLNTWEQLGIPNEERDYLNEIEYIQSLSTQQLPKEFEPLIEIYDFDHGVGRSCIPRKILKTISNSEGKEELVGTYKY